MCTSRSGVWRIEKARFVQACWHARVEVEEEACTPARKGVNQFSEEMPVGWRPGQPLVQEETVENQLEDIQSFAASAQVKDKHAKRVSIRLPPEAKDFALEFMALQQGRKNWKSAAGGLSAVV